MNFNIFKGHEYEFQMVSFVDVVFVLLSFFVLGSQFRMPEKDFGVGYSAMKLAAGVKSDDFPDKIQIELRPHGESVAIAIGGAKFADNDFAAITAKLAQINLPDLTVLIAAEPTLTVDQVARAMDAALASPMKNVSLAALAAPGAKARLPEAP